MQAAIGWGQYCRPDLVAILTLHGGRQICLHIEIQVWRERDFAWRVFAYQYRLRDRLRLPAASILLLADRSPGWRPTGFSKYVPGRQVTIRSRSLSPLILPRCRPGMSN